VPADCPAEGNYAIPRVMDEPDEPKAQPVDKDKDSSSDTSQWSVSAIVLIGDSGLTTSRPALTSLIAERLPVANVQGDRIFVRDGAVVSSSGSSAAIDLDLSLPDGEPGRDVAPHVARRLVVLLKRPEDQSHVNVHLAVHAVGGSRLENVQQYILNHPDADLSVNALARLAAMSARNFTRVFTQEAGVSPSAYVDLTRIDVARILLEGSSLSIDTIATKAGFGSPRAMRRAFIAHLGMTPSDYRARFATPADGSRPSLSDIG
jgi:transcriptional regulator GlxA family with amidase domain